MYDITYVMPDGFSVTVATNDSSGKPFAKYTYSPTDARTLPVATDLSDVSNATFAGWYTDADYTTAVTSVPAGSTGNKTYYAKYTRSITIYLEAIAGAGWGTTLASDVTAVYGKPLTAPDAVASASKTGYTLVGWKSGLDGVVSFVFGSTPYDDPCNGFIWGEWTEGSVTNFSGTVAEFSSLDFTIAGTGTEENPCPVTVNNIATSADIRTIAAKFEDMMGTDVYCDLVLNGTITTLGGNTVADTFSYGGSALCSVDLSGTSVTSIISAVFYGCNNLSSVTWPSNLESIAANAFSYTNLTSVTLPASVNKIFMTAFWECDELTTFDASGTWTLYDGDGNVVEAGITLDAERMKNPESVFVGFDVNVQMNYYYQKN